MPQYRVEAWLSTVTVEVEAENEDEAREKAEAELERAAYDELASATRQLHRVD